MNKPDSVLGNKMYSPLNYYEWTGIERKVNQHPYNTIQSLKSAITSTMSKIDKDHLILESQHFDPVLKQVLTLKNGFVE